MKARNLLPAILCLAFAVSPAVAFAQQTATVVVNGQTMQFDQPPIIQAGRVFVPMRAIFERLGASVVYANGQINATAPGGRSVQLTIGSTNAEINNRAATLDVAPFLVGDRTLVPLRFVSESLGSTVNWNDANSTVTIFSGRAVPVGQGPPPPPRGVGFPVYAPSGTVYNHYPQIRFQVNGQTRLSLMTVTLDGQDITSAFDYNGEYFYARTPFSLQIGEHHVTVRGRTLDGVAFQRTWSFDQATS